MGEVYVANDTRLYRQVAIKTPDERYANIAGATTPVTSAKRRQPPDNPSPRFSPARRDSGPAGAEKATRRLAAVISRGGSETPVREGGDRNPIADSRVGQVENLTINPIAPRRASGFQPDLQDCRDYGSQSVRTDRNADRDDRPS